MKNHKINIIASISLFLLYVITIIVDMLTVQRIEGYAIALTIGALVGFFVFLRKFEPMYYLGILGFSFFAMYFGTMLKFYSIIPIFDLLLHFASGILLVFLGHYAYTLILSRCKDYTIPICITAFFSGLFSLASAAAWEIWEYSGDVLLGLSSQGGIDDTMTDIIAGSIGAVIGTSLLYFILKKKSLTAANSKEMN